MIAPDRLHPETLRTLRQLVKLHGVPRLIEALRVIDALHVIATEPVDARPHGTDTPSTPPEPAA